MPGTRCNLFSFWTFHTLKETMCLTGTPAAIGQSPDSSNSGHSGTLGDPPLGLANSLSVHSGRLFVLSTPFYKYDPVCCVDFRCWTFDVRCWMFAALFGLSPRMRFNMSVITLAQPSRCENDAGGETPVSLADGDAWRGRLRLEFELLPRALAWCVRRSG